MLQKGVSIDRYLKHVLKICHFGDKKIGRLDYFFGGDITKISGGMTQVPGDITSDEMTSGRLVGKPHFGALRKA